MLSLPTHLFPERHEFLQIVHTQRIVAKMRAGAKNAHEKWADLRAKCAVGEADSKEKVVFVLFENLGDLFCDQSHSLRLCSVLLSAHL